MKRDPLIARATRWLGRLGRPASECVAARPWLSAIVDGNDSPASARQHVTRCAACTVELEAIRRLVGALGELPSRDVRDPAALFEAIAGRLETVPEGQRRARARQATGRRIQWIAIGLTAAAAFMLWIHGERQRGMARPDSIAAPPSPRALAGVLVPRTAELVRLAPSDDQLLDQARRELGDADRHYRSAIEDLEALADRERMRWPRSLTTAYAQKLASLDRAVVQGRAEAMAHPDDPSRQAALAARYQDEIGFLQDALARGQLALLDQPTGDHP